MVPRRTFISLAPVRRRTSHLVLASVLLLTGAPLLFGGVVVTNEVFSPILWGPSAIPGEYMQ
jgi:hypothetical protein